MAGADLLDGTPIYDIKPYLPYVDAHPDALGGFGSREAGRALQVYDPDGLLAVLDDQTRAGLVGVLENDPRPGYQHDPGRVYGLRFAGYEVKFTVNGDVASVVSINKE